MAHDYLFTATLEHLTGLPEDRIVTTFPISWTGAGDPAPADLDLALAQVVLFFNAANTTQAIAAYLSAEASRAADASIVRVYDIAGKLDGSPHGSAVDELPFTLGAADGAADIPAECAVVLTTRATGWQAAPVEAADGADPGALVDRPRQRLSGRNFIGPLSSSATAVISDAMRVATIMVTDLLDAGQDLQLGLQGFDFEWNVWSRVNEAVVPITHLQVDNAVDTMRKRGPDPTVRTTRTI